MYVMCENFIHHIWPKYAWEASKYTDMMLICKIKWVYGMKSEIRSLMSEFGKTQQKPK